jgi:beta-1,4-mannooligosaccharide/beta-1,4-mannosyl-N-acetylglucosamine phosphorylase
MSEPIIASLESSPVITRHPQNPVLSSKDVPYRSALVFNAGVAKHDGKYVMVFRNDYGSLRAQRIDGTNIGLALSDNGISWEVQPKPCFTPLQWIRFMEPEDVLLLLRTLKTLRY